jgi:O-antigen/teichoic acid export membrane protein
MPEPSVRRSLLAQLAGRVGRHTSVYAVGSAASLVLSLVNLAIITRYLSAPEFGRLALLLFFAALLTVTYNLGSLQGTMNSVFGSDGEEETDASDEPTVRDRRAAMGTGIVLTVTAAGAGTAVVALLARPLGELLVDDAGAADAVMLAAASGAFGSVWRLATNILRLERRPVAFVGQSLLRPILVLAAVIPAVTSGLGVTGAIGGVAAGTAVATVVALVQIRSRWRIAFSAALARHLMKVGSPFIVVIVSFWVVQNVDLFLLSRFASTAEVGEYRVATRLASVISYFTSAFLMAWGALRLSALATAADRAHGPEISRWVTLYYVLFSLWILLGLAVGADAVLVVVAGDYSVPSGLVPLVASGFVAYGALVVTYRLSRFHGRRRRYVMVVGSSALLFVGFAFLLIPPLGASGAALAVTLTFASATIVMYALGRRSAEPIRLDARRLLVALGLAAALGLGGAVLSATTSWEWIYGLAVIALFPFVLVAADALPREHARAAWVGLTSRGERRQVESGGLDVERLEPGDLALLELVVGVGLPVDEAAGIREIDSEAALRRLVGTLRTIGATGAVGPHDASIGDYLFRDRSVAERDGTARHLWAEGADPVEVHRLEETLTWLRTDRVRERLRELAPALPELDASRS